MPVINESALKEKLRSEPVGVYLLFGDEGYLKKIYTEKIISKSVDKNFADFNFHAFEGSQTSLSEIYDSVLAVPLMAETTCVLVRDMPFDSFNDSDMEQLETLLSECPQECSLIFVTLAQNITGAKWNATVKLFEKYGSAVRFNRKTAAELISLLESGAKKRGSVYAKGAAAYLTACVGMDLNTLFNETEKLCAYAAQREITKADIDKICVKSVDATAFEMLRALRRGRFDIAFEKLDTLFYLHIDPNMILGALISSYADIYRAKCAVKAGKKAGYIAEFYNYGSNDFRLNNAAHDASGFSFEAISECVEILAKADAELKGSAIDERLILEQTLVNLALTEGNKS